jgi:serpin B
MKTAFDVPNGSANFDRMAPRTPDGYLAISNVFHRTFIELDEEGSEAAAATAVKMAVRSAAKVGARPPPPPEIHVDHPFLFAIQHRASGACLFLGRVVDPR